MAQRGQQPGSTRVTRRTTPRRDNAPIRKRKSPGTLPDLLFAIGAAGWSMAFVLFIASFMDDNVTAGDAGRLLARIFAGALFISGLFVILLGLSLMRSTELHLEDYIFPVSLGVVVGALEAWLFLLPAGQWLFLPMLLLVFALRPVRSRIGQAVHAK